MDLLIKLENNSQLIFTQEPEAKLRQFNKPKAQERIIFLNQAATKL